MDRHSVLRPRLVPAAENSMSKAWFMEGVLRKLRGVLPSRHGGLHRLLDHGQKAHHELIVGGPDNGRVKGPVGPGAVVSLTDAALHLRPALQNLGQLPFGGAAAGQPRGLGLKNLPQLKQVPQLTRT